MEISVTRTGPLFDGRADRAVDEFIDEAKREVASQGLADIHEELDHVLRDPSPYYETRVTMERAGADYRVHDQDVVYGPWLEGTSQRNRSTRFKGYAHWRRTRQALQAKAHDIAEDVLQRHLPQMGGGGR